MTSLMATYFVPITKLKQQPNNTLTTMMQTNLFPELEKEEFLDELFNQLFDLAPIDSDTDKVPDFRILLRG